MESGIKIEGLKELKMFLEKELPENLRRTSMLAGMRQSLKPMIEAGKANAPVRSGALRESIKQRTVPKRDVNFAAIVWGPTTNVPGAQQLWLDEYGESYHKGEFVIGGKKKSLFKEPYYGKFLEFGYENARTGRFVPGKYFLTRAFDSHYKTTYLSSLVRSVEKKAIAAAKRHNAKSKANNKRNRG